MRDLVRFMYDNTVSITGEYTNWAARQGAREKAKEGGSMLVHKGTLWYALESGIKLVLSARLFKSHFVRWG